MYSVLIKWIKGVFLSAIFIAFFHEVNGQNNLYAIALKEFLSDSIKIDRYNVYEEHIKYNSVLVSLEGNRFNLPSSCLGYNLEYTSECDICDLITKKNERLVLRILSSQLYDTTNLITIKVIPYSVRRYKNNCVWKIFAGGGFSSRSMSTQFYFNCSKEVWEQVYSKPE